ARFLDRGKELVELEVGDAHPQVAADRLVLAVQAHGAGELAAGDAELERVEAQYLILHDDAGRQMIERQLLRPLDGAGADLHVGIDASPPAGIEGRIGEHAVLLLRLVGPDQRAEVDDVQHLGGDVAGHARALAAGVDLERAGEIALADLGGELLVADHPAVAHQAAGGGVRAGGRESDVDDVVQVVERLAAQRLELQVEALEADDAGDRALQLDRGVADLRL